MKQVGHVSEKSVDSQKSLVANQANSPVPSTPYFNCKMSPPFRVVSERRLPLCFEVMKNVTPTLPNGFVQNMPVLNLRMEGKETLYIVIGYSGKSSAAFSVILERGVQDRIFTTTSKELASAYAKDGGVFTFGLPFEEFVETINRLYGFKNTPNEVLFDPELLQAYTAKSFGFESNDLSEDLLGGGFFQPLRRDLSKQLTVLDVQWAGKERQSDLDRVVSDHLQGCETVSRTRFIAEHVGPQLLGLFIAWSAMYLVLSLIYGFDLNSAKKLK